MEEIFRKMSNNLPVAPPYLSDIWLPGLETETFSNTKKQCTLHKGYIYF